MAEKSESRSKDMMIFVVSTIIMCIIVVLPSMVLGAIALRFDLFDQSV
ncbi:MAG: hypothetical protein IPL98_12045 [Saprospiraceae bacterium]|nr:hypothetical protein [Saprospiraceae bacterium]